VEGITQPAIERSFGLTRSGNLSTRELRFWHMIDLGIEPYFTLALDRMAREQEIGAGG